jgi:transposase-like protein
MGSISPKTLLEAVTYFSSPENCREYMIPRRWADGIVKCPTCGTEKVKFQPQHNRWQCSVHHPKRQFTLKTGTIMEDSPIGLDKWLPAIWLLCSNRNGISSWELHRALGVTQKTAWFMLGRIRTAMQDETSGGKIGGSGEPVMIDETYIGGLARNMHRDKHAERKSDITGSFGKMLVFGALERGGKVKTAVASDRKKKTLAPFVRENVEQGAEIHTDEHQTDWWKADEYEHKMVNHLERYVDGNVHTNGIENFWALLKREIKGTYVSVEPFHLFRYVDEEAFRYNNRLPMSDGDRFSYLVRKCVGKRLTYAELIGHEIQPTEAF